MGLIRGKNSIAKHRRAAKIMIVTGFARVVVWTSLCGLYLAKAAFAVTLFRSVEFVALLSVLALALTDWGQVAASLAQLNAVEAHHDAQEGRRETALDLDAIESDVERLAELEPGAEAQQIAQAIRKRLAT